MFYIKSYCSPCNVEYKTVIHFEHIREEAYYLNLLLEPRHILPSRWDNPTRVEGFDEEDVTKKYFQMLDINDVKALYKIYERDFRMFGYEYTFKQLKLPMW